ncbi:unnamed protein product [Psylliodes chrysocephalus]|uniref:C-type lectin domain-containing protein n=1 Tax=Psylliodes chrysocephalus TaxID=3402493 RepID=A0A9P0G637_9CUCU|nr:unnamed protein product [Psylliodes chrysocephala]
MHSLLAIWSVFICFTATNAFAINGASLWLDFEIGEKSYSINGVLSNFEQAGNLCKGRNQQLVAIESLDENNNIMKELKKLVDVSTELWTSGSKQANSNKWIWSSTNEEITDFDWGTGEPNNKDGVENCIVFYPNTDLYFEGSWADINCNLSVALPFCQKASKN